MRMPTLSKIVALTTVAAGNVAYADEGNANALTVNAEGLAPIDWAIIVVYGAGTILLGWFYSRRQTSTREYFVGSGNMNPILIGVSLFATLLSTISYLSMPGEALGKGPVHMTSMVALPVVFYTVGFLLIPVYMKQRVTSAYELLEAKLGTEVRLLGAGLFIALRLAWMSLLIYLTAKALTIMLGVSEAMIPTIALITGFVAVIYTSLGGLRAVVITDLLQTILLFGGALLVLGTITYQLGGVSWIPTKWNPSWDTQPIASFDLSTRVTFIGSLLNYFVWYTCTLGGDQTSVQRFMATTDAAAARRALLTQMLVNLAVTITLGLVGFALLGYFDTFPEQLAPGISLKENADKIFPHFIAFHLPAGISGLVVAAMFAAAMSSVDSGVNSITAVVMTDFLGRKSPTEAGEVEVPETAAKKASQMGIARWLAFGIGAFVVTGSSAMGLIPGNITEVTTKTANLFSTPIFALFFFALFVPFASSKGVIIGCIAGVITAIVVAFGGPIVLALHLNAGVDPASLGSELITKVDAVTGLETLTCKDPISFQLIGPIAIVVDIIVGCVASKLFPSK